MSNENMTTHVLNENVVTEPETATKVLKKRGRKGNKIVTAFDQIPSTPVNFNDFAASHGVTTNVLRQIKRHDRFTSRGKVFVRKNKETKTMMIWRETLSDS